MERGEEMKKNIVLSWRKRIGLTQEEMASKLGIGVVTYRSKERGITEFKRSEIENFTREVMKVVPEVTVSEIFFDL